MIFYEVTFDIISHDIEIIFLFLYGNRYLLELPQWDASIEYPQHMFSLEKYEKIYGKPDLSHIMKDFTMYFRCSYVMPNKQRSY